MTRMTSMVPLSQFRARFTLSWTPVIGRQSRTGGTLLSREQEQEICNIVMANNAITRREIRNTIIQDNLIFQNINTISISTIDRVVKKHEMSMKQLYRVPFERNSDRVKELRFQYVNVS
ncbi:hypothetical protein ABVT39_024454 [Epinephelus coioides]